MPLDINSHNYLLAFSRQRTRTGDDRSGVCMSCFTHYNGIVIPEQFPLREVITFATGPVFIVHCGLRNEEHCKAKGYWHFYR